MAGYDRVLQVPIIPGTLGPMGQWAATINGPQKMTLKRLTDRLGTWTPLPCPIEATDGDLTLTGRLDFRNGRFGIWEVTITSATGPVTGEKLRRVPMGDIVRSLAIDMVLTIRRDDHGVSTLAPIGPPPASTSERGPSTEQLEYLADLYSLAAAVGDPPTKSVAAALGISVPTATRWANRARSRQLLPAIDNEED